MFTSLAERNGGFHRGMSAKANNNDRQPVADNAPRPKLWGSCRLSVAFSVFFASVQINMLRDNHGIALMCMSRPVGNLSCDANDAVVPTFPWLTNRKNCEFDWDPPTRGRVLGSFLYGYILTSMAGGFMAKSYGVKIPFVCAGIGNVVFHLLCPTAVLLHTELFFACRLLQGMSAGLTVGPVFQLFSAWTSDEEVSTLLSFGLSGFSFGSIVAYPLSGYLCTANYNGFGGWPLIYYVPAVVSVSFVAFWCRYLYNEPADHPNISQEEYTYLMENVDISDEPATIPWKSIFTSLPFVAYMVCYSSFLWNVLTCMNHVPVFMQTVLGVSSEENGYLFCIPLIFTFMVRILNGKTYPLFKKHSGLSDTICRKLYYTFGNLMVIVSLSTIIFVPNVTKWHAVAAISITLAIGDFAYTGGFYPTLLNLAPNYIGILSGISTFVAFLVASPSTIVNSIILKQNTKEEWNMVLWIIIAIYTFSILFYIIFGSTLLQKWSIAQGERIVSRSTLVATRSYAMSRNLSMIHPTHVF